jgi:hypothetical protein
VSSSPSFDCFNQNDAPRHVVRSLSADEGLFSLIYLSVVEFISESFKFSKGLGNPKVEGYDLRLFALNDGAFSLKLSDVTNKSVLADHNERDVVRLTDFRYCCRCLIVLVKKDDQLSLSELVSLSLDELSSRADLRASSNIGVHFTQPLGDSGCDVLADVFLRHEEIVSNISLLNLPIINNKEAGFFIFGRLAAARKYQVLQSFSTSRTSAEHDDASFGELFLAVRSPETSLSVVFILRCH